MNQAKKKIVWQQCIGTAFSMLIGAICGYVMVMFIDNFSDDTPLYIEILSLVGLFECSLHSSSIRLSMKQDILYLA